MKLVLWLTTFLLLTPIAWTTEPVFEIRAVAEHPNPSTQEYLQAAAEGEKPERVYLEPETLLGLEAVLSASAVYVGDDRWTVRLNLSGDGSDRIAEITTKYLGKRIAVLINGKMFFFGTVHATVKGGLEIGTNLTSDAAFGLADDLNAAVAKAAAATPGTP